MGQPNPADGATPPAEPTTTEPAKTEPSATDALGDPGKKALTELRQQNKELAAQLKELQARDPVKALADALGLKPADAKPDELAATVKQLQQQMRDAELRAIRLEVAAEKGLTPAQAARLTGSTREELEADADELKQLFPSSATPGTPAPDPSQGARGSINALDAQITALQAKADSKDPAERSAAVKELIRLKQQRAALARK